jgi:hypothetical protein
MDMDEKQIDELIKKALSDESSLPEGLADRLEKAIDEHAAGHGEEKENHAKQIRLFSRHNLYWISGAAASIAVCIGIFFFIQSRQPKLQADTFQDPQQAELVAQKALALVSTKMNKGIDGVNNADASIRKTQKILDDTLFDNSNENN